MKTNKKWLVMMVMLVGVVLMGSGCVSFDKGASSQEAHVNSDGSLHQSHSMWNLCDPFTAIGKFFGDVNVNVNVATVQNGYAYSPGYVVYQHPGCYLDYRYNMWCTNGRHIAPDPQRGGELREFPDHPQHPPSSH